MRRVVRHRHRTWMLSMTMASLGWGAWWLALLLRAVAPSVAPGVWPTMWVSCACAAVGFAWGLVTLRAKLAWVALAAIPLCANASLLLLPVILPYAHLDLPE